MFLATDRVWKLVFIEHECTWGESVHVCHMQACVVFAGWIHAFTSVLCVRECLCNTYVCPYIPAYDVYLSVGQQFYCWADVRISISPSCFQFQMGLDFPRPYWFIITCFDYLSMGSHIHHKAFLQQRNKETKAQIKRRKLGSAPTWVINLSSFLVNINVSTVLKTAMKVGIQHSISWMFTLALKG